MDRKLSSVEHLNTQVRELAPIVAGLRRALDTLALSDAERETLSALLDRYGSLYEESKNVLRKIQGTRVGRREGDRSRSLNHSRYARPWQRSGRSKAWPPAQRGPTS